MYGKDDANGRWQSAAPLESWAVPVGLDNPYLTAQESTLISNALATNFPNTTGALAGSAPGIRYVYPGNDLLATKYFTDNVFLNNQPGNPLGETRQITINNTYQGTAGFKAKFMGWNLDGYGQKGETHQDYVDTNGTRTDRLFFAMDAVTDPTSGQTVCRVASQSYDPLYYKSFANCAPINMFGGWSNISPAATAYVSGPTKYAHQVYGLTNGELNANGTIFSGIGAGDWKMALGISYRKESIFQTTPDPSNEYPAFLGGQLISTVIPTQPATFRGVIPQGFYLNKYGYTAPWPTTAGSSVLNSAGVPTGGIPGLYYVPTGFLGDASSSTIEFSSERTFAGDSVVREGFVEFNLPLLRDKFLINSLSADLAYREADYSGSGAIPAWKVGGDWAINDTVRLRATRSRDVRAASLEERFDQTRGGVTVQNPYVLTNGAPTTQSGAGFSGGNPGLKPERADTWTAGFVVTPTFLPNFSTSVDWYDISISNAIDKPTTQQIINAAFAGDPTYQALVKLDAGNNVVEVDQYYINFAQAFVEGVDLESSYRHSANLLSSLGFGDGPEDTSVRLYFTDTIKNATLTSFGTYEEYAGQVGTGRSIPKQKYTINWNYDKGPYSLFVQGRYISHGILDNTLIESPVALPGAHVLNNQAAAGTIYNNTIGGIFYMDLNLAYQIPVSGGDFRAFIEVQNAFDRSPPTVAGAIGRTGDAENNPLLYDVLGRRYTMGVTYRWQ
jgi:outer membrane receptor protein involved in Fe transport